MEQGIEFIFGAVITALIVGLLVFLYPEQFAPWLSWLALLDCWFITWLFIRSGRVKSTLSNAKNKWGYMVWIIVFLAGGILSIGYLAAINTSFSALAKAHEKSIKPVPEPNPAPRPKDPLSYAKPSMPADNPSLVPEKKSEKPSGTEHTTQKPSAQTPAPPTPNITVIQPSVGNLKQRTNDVVFKIRGLIQHQKDFLAHNDVSFPKPLTPQKMAEWIISNDRQYRFWCERDVVSLQKEYAELHIRSKDLDDAIREDEDNAHLREQYADNPMHSMGWMDIAEMEDIAGYLEDLEKQLPDK
jgi:flagellar basal body-associated protein FliL